MLGWNVTISTFELADLHHCSRSHGEGAALVPTLGDCVQRCMEDPDCSYVHMPVYAGEDLRPCSVQRHQAPQPTPF